MLAASTILSSLTGAAQKEVLRDAAKFMGKGDKDSQTQAIYDYFKLKFGADQVNSIFGVMKNLSCVLKK